MSMDLIQKGLDSIEAKIAEFASKAKAETEAVGKVAHDTATAIAFQSLYAKRFPDAPPPDRTALALIARFRDQGRSREDGRVTCDRGLRSLQRPFAPAGAPTGAASATVHVPTPKRDGACTNA